MPDIILILLSMIGFILGGFYTIYIYLFEKNKIGILFTIFMFLFGVIGLHWFYQYSLIPWRIKTTLLIEAKKLNKTDVISYNYDGQLYIINLNQQLGRSFNGETIKITIWDNDTYIGIFPTINFMRSPTYEVVTENN